MFIGLIYISVILSFIVLVDEKSSQFLSTFSHYF